MQNLQYNTYRVARNLQFNTYTIYRVARNSAAVSLMALSDGSQNNTVVFRGTGDDLKLALVTLAAAAAAAAAVDGV